jgi:hypothetical protein
MFGSLNWYIERKRFVELFLELLIKEKAFLLWNNLGEQDEIEKTKISTIPCLVNLNSRILSELKLNKNLNHFWCLKLLIVIENFDFVFAKLHLGKKNVFIMSFNLITFAVDLTIISFNDEILNQKWNWFPKLFL